MNSDDDGLKLYGGPVRDGKAAARCRVAGEHCQCARYSASCSAPITREDLLCNACRIGCTLIAFGPVGEFPDLADGQHVLVTDFAFSFASPVQPAAVWPLAERPLIAVMPLGGQNREALFSPDAASGA